MVDILNDQKVQHFRISLENQWGDRHKAKSKNVTESNTANFISRFQIVKTELYWLIVELCYTVSCNFSNSSFAALPIQKQFKKEPVLLLPSLSDVSTCLGISECFETFVFLGERKKIKSLTGFSHCLEHPVDNVLEIQNV